MEAPPPRRQRRSARALALLLLALAAGCCSARDAPSARESKAAAHTKAAARQHRQHHPRHNAAAAALAAALPAPPVAPRRPHVVEANGDARTDDYYWLRDDARTNPDVLAYLKAENDYAAAALNSTAPLRARLYEEMRARVKEQDAGVATRYKGHWYYSRTRAGSQYQTHVRAPAAPGPLTERSAPPALAAGSGDGAAAGAAAAAAAAAEQVLLDEDARRREVGAAFYMLDALEASPDQRLLAWSEDVEGGERYDLYVKDIATGRILDGPVRGTSGSVMWGEDSKTLVRAGRGGGEGGRGGLLSFWGVVWRGGKGLLGGKPSNKHRHITISMSHDTMTTTHNTHHTTLQQRIVLRAQGQARPPLQGHAPHLGRAAVGARRRRLRGAGRGLLCVDRPRRERAPAVYLVRVGGHQRGALPAL